MVDCVVDTSVVIEYLVSSTYTAYAETLFEQLTEADQLVVPEFCLLECANVIWKQVRFQGMPEDQAAELLTDLLALRLARVQVKDDLDHALRIGLKHKLAIYDSTYIALALRFDFPLITIDQSQSRAAQAEGVTLKPVTDFS